MDRIVICVGNPRNVPVSIVTVVVNVVPQHGQNGPVVTFNLAIRLRMVRAGKPIVDTETLAHGLEQLRGELRTVVR